MRVVLVCMRVGVSVYDSGVGVCRVSARLPAGEVCPVYEGRPVGHTHVYNSLRICW